MGKLILFAVLLAGASVGYLLWTSQTTTPAPSAFTNYTQGLQDSEQKAQAAASGANLDNVRSAVEKYKSEKGGWPSTLRDLVPDYLDHVPDGLQYDPATGSVSAAP